MGKVQSVTQRLEFLSKMTVSEVHQRASVDTHIGLDNRRAAREQQWSTQCQGLPDPPGPNSAVDLSELRPE